MPIRPSLTAALVRSPQSRSDCRECRPPRVSKSTKSLMHIAIIAIAQGSAVEANGSETGSEDEGEDALAELPGHEAPGAADSPFGAPSEEVDQEWLDDLREDVADDEEVALRHERSEVIPDALCDDRSSSALLPERSRDDGS